MMARRPGAEGQRFNPSPRMLRIGGWLVALALVAGIAIVVGVLGGDADGPPAGTSPSASGVTAQAKIMFGTVVDSATGEIPTDAQTDRFTATDMFAYSVTVPGPLPDPVYVEVRRTGGGAVEIVQAPVDSQEVEYPPAIAFDVPADDLFQVFGPGDYLMLIYAEAEGPPIAEGTFVLVGADASPSASP
jgi:hypothetical protein